LTTNVDHGGIASVNTQHDSIREEVLMSLRTKTLLAAVVAVGVAAFNAGLPWW